MPWVDTRKTDYGFEYLVGTIPVARAKWRKVDGAWQVEVFTLAEGDAPMSSIFDTATMPLKHVTAYIHRRLEKPMPTPEID